MPKGAIPSVRITAQALPQPGRLTNPVGTYLDNPASASDGAFGAGGGANNVPQIELSPLQQYHNATALPGWFGNGPATGGAPTALTMYHNATSMGNPTITAPAANLQGVQLFDSMNRPLQEGQVNPVAYDADGQRYTFNVRNGKYENAELQSNAFTPSAAKANPLVGMNLESQPKALSLEVLQKIFPGQSLDNLKQLMLSRGYEFQPGAARNTRGGPTFVFTGKDAQGNPVAGPNPNKPPSLLDSVDSRGRPFQIDPTQLARGERVQVASGNTFVGGADYTNPQGETVSQYAVTLTQNINRRLEREGAYKWKKKTVKDKDGNWVAVYSKELRKSWKNAKKNARLEGDANAVDANAGADNSAKQGADLSQLVNLRVSYG